MIRFIAPAIVAALLLLTSAPADAFFMTCGDARSLGESAEDGDSVIGHSFGALDAFAGLLCFVGDSKCDCLVDTASNRPREFSREFNRALQNCDDAAPAFGVAFQAAEALCAN
ncbi:MAG: hypothetical protein P8R42_27290 [Candidatus Binatia bacterium]|nr:hypothetical protein [Candidatus Binatia bacterium]